MAEQPTPIADKTRRRALIWMCVLIGTSQLGFGAIVPTLPLYASSFGVTAFAVGVTIAVFGLARFLFTVPAGQLADKFGRRPTLAVGAVISALGNAWCAWAASYGEFVLARFVAGGGSAIVLTAGAIVLADVSRMGTRGRTMALYQASFIFAVGVGPLPGGVLAEWYGLGVPFIAFGALSLAAGAIAWFAVPETQHLALGANQNKPVPALRDQFKVLWADTGFLLVGCVNMINAFVRTGAIFNVVPVIAVINLGLSPSQIGAAFAIGSVLGLLATYPGGYVSDRFGRKMVIVPGLLLKAVAIVLYATATGFSSFLVASILWGVTVSLAGSAPAAYAADKAPTGMNAVAMSGYRLMGEMGYIIGPLLLGAMVDWSSAVSVLWLCAAIVVTIALTFARFAKETARPV